jgi:hypothetical protein
MKKFGQNSVLIIFTILALASCRIPESLGFYQPITMNLVAPDGPAEYKAGWYAGCKTALAIKTFSNSFVYGEGLGPDMGSGVYQHDPAYQTGWGQGYFSCVTHIAGFVTRSSMEFSPLQ